MAGFRKAELQHLDALARLVTTSGEDQEAGGSSHVPAETPALDSTASRSWMTDMESASLDEDIMLGENFLDGLTKEHILGVAGSIADEEMAWMYDNIAVQGTSQSV